MANKPTQWSERLLTGIVRLLGIVLMVTGLWIAIYVLNEVLKLYDSPVQIAKLAVIIEQAAHLDKSLADLSKTAEKKDNTDLRLSYFTAWIFGLLLLFLAGHLALSAVKIGGQLVLYNRS